MAVVDLSPVGASLHLESREVPDTFLGQHFAGTLLAPAGEGLRLRLDVRRAVLHPSATGILLGVAFLGVGFEQTARIVDWLPMHLPEPHDHAGHSHGGHAHGHHPEGEGHPGHAPPTILLDGLDGLDGLHGSASGRR
jgi:hypothetical protein